MMGQDLLVNVTDKRIPKKYYQDAIPYRFPEGALQGGPATCTAIRTKTAGLIVTPVVILKHGENVFEGHGYTITHQYTGASVLPAGRGVTIRVARLVAGVLGGICDWTEADKDAMTKKGAAALNEYKLMDWLRREVAA
jgi:hypothetical protein